MAKQITTQDYRVRPVIEQNIKALFAFERNNAAYFERWVPARPEHYQTLLGFQTATLALMNEAASGKRWLGLIFCNDEIAGRINLNDIQHGSAELGYRIGETHAGNGVASWAVSKVLSIAHHQLHLTHIKAVASDNNPASTKVLIKNGFHPQHNEVSRFLLNGEHLLLQTYRRDLGDLPHNLSHPE